MTTRKQRISGVLAIVFALISIVGTIPAHAQAAVQQSSLEIFVSPDGNDSAAGTMDAPLKTLEGARDKLREIKKSQGIPVGGATVTLLEGEYKQLETSFELEAQDSGTKNSPIVYRANPGDTASITGNLIVEGGDFKPVSEQEVLARLPQSARSNVVVYDLKGNLGIENFGEIIKNGFNWPTLPPSLSITVDGEKQTLARYPNEGFINVRASDIQDRGFVPRSHMTNPDGTCPACSKKQNSRVVCEIGVENWVNQNGGIWTVNDQSLHAKADLWAQESDIWVNGYFCWAYADDNMRLKSVSKTTAGMQFAAQHPSFYGVGGGDSTKFFAYNLLCEIDSPGEWYLDRETGKLYLYPESDITNSSVEISMMSAPLIAMKGVEHVQIQNLTFSKSNSHGIEMLDSNNCMVAGCNFFDLGQRAVMVGKESKVLDVINNGAQGGYNNQVISCNITRMGQGGIYLAGGNRYKLTPGNNRAENCDISDFSTVKRTYSPAVALVGVGNSAVRNKIYNAPHMAISYDGNNMTIAGNDISNVCYETSDVGAIYSCRTWSYRGIKIENNYIHDIITSSGTGSAAVYCDDLMSGAIVRKNLFVNIPGYTMLFGGGRDNIIEKNIQINAGNGKGIHYDNRGEGWAANAGAVPDGNCYAELTYLRNQPSFDKNNWDASYPELSSLDLETRGTIGNDRNVCIVAVQPADASVQNNIFVGVQNAFGNINQRVRSLGTVANNQTHAQGTDIGFINPEALNFGVKEDSLIQKQMGDDYFDQAQVGLFVDEFRTSVGEKVEAPVLVSPEVDAQDVPFSDGVVLRWNKANGAGTYLVEISKNETFDTVDKVASTEELGTTILGLEKSSTYFWRITAIEGRVGGGKATSPVRKFTTSATASNSFYESFGEDRFEGWKKVKGTPSNTQENAHAGKYSYIINEDEDVIQKTFGTNHKSVVTMWLYDNMQKTRNTVAMGNVSTESNGTTGWAAMGVRVSAADWQDVYAVRIGGDWFKTQVPRSEGWHELKWDFTGEDGCKMFIDEVLVKTNPTATSFNAIAMGDFWKDNGISKMMFDDIRVGNPVIEPVIEELTLNEEEIGLLVGETFQLQANTVVRPDVEVDLKYSSLEHEIAFVDSNGFVTANRAGQTIITLQAEGQDAKAECKVTVIAAGEKAELQRLVDAYKDLSPVAYTQDSWSIFEEALEQAQAILLKEEAPAENIVQAIQDLKNAIDALEREISNIIENSSFEDGTLTGWNHYPASPSEGITVETIQEGHTDLHAAQVTTTGTIPNYAIKGLLYRLEGDSFDRNSQYFVSYWAKSVDQKERELGIRAIYRKSGSSEDANFVSVGDDWQQVSFIAKNMPEDTEYIEFVLGNRNNNDSAGTYLIDDVVIYKLGADNEFVPVTAIALDEDKQNLQIGESVQLQATITPTEATCQNIIWISSNPDVVTVENGKVTAVGTGTAIITVYTEDKGQQANCEITVALSIDKLKELYDESKLVEDKQSEYTESSWTVFQEAFEKAGQLLEATEFTEEELQAVYTELLNAKNALVKQSPEWLLEALIKLIEQCKEVKETLYTPTSWKNFSEKLATAETLVADSKQVNAEQINEAYLALTKAISSLEHVGNRALLQQAIESAHKKLESNEEYMEITVENLRTVLGEAEELIADPQASEEEIRNMFEKLTVAITTLGIQGDKSGLEELLKIADSKVESHYSSESWAIFEAAKEEASTVLADENADEIDVEEAIGKLITAMSGLENGVNFQNLQITIEMAQAILENATDYAPKSLEGLSEELEKAVAVYEDRDSTQEIVNTTQQNLYQQILKAYFKANKDALIAAIQSAEKINLRKYTSRTVSFFRKALEDAKVIVEDENAEQLKVDETLNDLEEARSDLTLRETNSSSSTGRPDRPDRPDQDLPHRDRPIQPHKPNTEKMKTEDKKEETETAFEEVPTSNEIKEEVVPQQPVETPASTINSVDKAKSAEQADEFTSKAKEEAVKKPKKEGVDQPAVNENEKIVEEAEKPEEPRKTRSLPLAVATTAGVASLAAAGFYTFRFFRK